MYYNSRTNEIKRFFSDLLEQENAAEDFDKVKQLSFDVEDIMDELIACAEEDTKTLQELEDEEHGTYNEYLRWKNEA